MIVAPPEGLPDRYLGGWRHWARWCAVTDNPALPTGPHDPTDPLVVYRYLSEHCGDAPATARGRITAINHAHVIMKHSPPGRHEVIRQALSRRRAERLARLATVVDRRLPGIPSLGWPHGLFGRRDAALLVLAAAGLSAPRISALTRGDVTEAKDVVLVGDPPICIEAARDPYRCPAAALRRWLTTHELVAQPYGRGLLEHHLQTRTLADPEVGTVRPDVPLFTSFDRFGWTPLPDVDPVTGRRPVLQPLSAESVTAIVRAHVSGRAAPHRHRRAIASTDEPKAASPMAEIILDPDYHEAGVTARQRGTAGLGAEIDDLLADFDAGAAELNARIAALVELATGSSDPSSSLTPAPSGVTD
ncbi:hypothetical protein [Nocardia sp. NPDC050710]|uniref:hypothetical protein n=1 Tax=Nocardia sp. NPDC050710 TaxID=3157220 RepID=UPI0033EB1C60